MLKKNNFFDNFFIKSKLYSKNLKATKKVYNSFKIDLNNSKYPLFKSYEKKYQLSFTAETIKKFSKYKNIIIFGMGGSILGAKSIYSFFKKKVKKKVFFFDNLDFNLIAEYKKIKNLNNSCFVVISKSGNTLETLTNLSTIFSKNMLKKKLVIITEKTDNNLLFLAKKYQAEVIEHKKFIGGRYSVLSETGMFPAALMGLNIEKFKNLTKLINSKDFVKSLIKNVAYIYTLNQKGINNSVIFSYNSDLNELGYWYQQRVAESLGKKGKGINPIISFGPKDHHSLLQLFLDGPQDKFFTFFNSSNKNNQTKMYRKIAFNNMSYLKNKNIETIINAQCNSVKNIFKKKKIPFRQITFTQKRENELGEIFTFFVLETVLLSRLMEIDPFDQPAVEQVKIETKRLLEK